MDSNLSLAANHPQETYAHYVTGMCPCPSPVRPCTNGQSKSVRARGFGYVRKVTHIEQI